MLEALILGERDPQGLAQLARASMRLKIPALTACPGYHRADGAARHGDGTLSCGPGSAEHDPCVPTVVADVIIAETGARAGPLDVSG